MSYSATERSVWVWALVSMVLGASAFGCESPKSKANLDVGRDGSASGGEGGSSTSDKVVLPGGFEPAIECGGLGQTCGVSTKCPGKLDCAGANCMPKVDGKNVVTCGDASCPEDAPMCVLAICLTVDQLACVCAEPDAQKVYRQCKSVLVDPNATCIEADGLCDASPDACCDGLRCLQGKDGTGRQKLGLCKAPCTTTNDCEAGECCASAEGVAGSFCGPRDLCVKACRDENEECDGDLKPCCDGLICADSPEDPALDGCKLVCAKNTDCETGCCILFTGRDNGVCAPKDRCPPAM